MKPLEYFYPATKQVVEFDITEEVMVNATEMGQIFGKRPIDFLKQEGTKAFIGAMESAFPAFESEGESLSNAGNALSEFENETRSEDSTLEFVRTRRGADDQGATWMHRLLALKFAAWLDPKFEVWIYQTIEQILFNNAKKNNDELRQKARIVNRLGEIRNQHVDVSWFQEYQQLERMNRQIAGRIAKNNNAQLGLFRGE